MNRCYNPFKCFAYQIKKKIDFKNDYCYETGFVDLDINEIEKRDSFQSIQCFKLFMVSLVLLNTV